MKEFKASSRGRKSNVTVQVNNNNISHTPKFFLLTYLTEEISFAGIELDDSCGDDHWPIFEALVYEGGRLGDELLVERYALFCELMRDWVTMCACGDHTIGYHEAMVKVAGWLGGKPVGGA